MVKAKNIYANLVKPPIFFGVLMIVGLVVTGFGSMNTVPSGTATAYGHEAPAGAKCLKIIGTRATGVMTVTKVEVTDMFGRPKAVKYSMLTGGSSSTPKIQFDPPLEKGDEVYVELATSEPKDSRTPKDHGILETEWC